MCTPLYLPCLVLCIDTAGVTDVSHLLQFSCDGKKSEQIEHTFILFTFCFVELSGRCRKCR